MCLRTTRDSSNIGAARWLELMWMAPLWSLWIPAALCSMDGASVIATTAALPLAESLLLAEHIADYVVRLEATVHRIVNDCG